MNEAHNPYRAPDASPGHREEAQIPVQLPTAGKGRRFLTFLVDYVGQLVFMMIGLLPVVIALPAVGLWIEGMNRVQELALGVVIMLAYYVLFESLWGRTPGKWICGTRVMDERGLPASFTQVLGRTFARLIPFEALSLLFSSDDDPRGWHDSLPKTRVVRTR